MVGQLKKVADSSQQQSAIEQVKPSEGNKSVATTGSQSFQVMQTELAEEDEEKEEGQDETKKEEDSFKIPQATVITHFRCFCCCSNECYTVLCLQKNNNFRHQR